MLQRDCRYRVVIADKSLPVQTLFGAFIQTQFAIISYSAFQFLSISNIVSPKRIFLLEYLVFGGVI